jgi:hypothetical protein
MKRERVAQIQGSRFFRQSAIVKALMVNESPKFEIQILLHQRLTTLTLRQGFALRAQNPIPFHPKRFL